MHLPDALLVRVLELLEWAPDTSAAVRATCSAWRSAHDAALPRLEITADHLMLLHPPSSHTARSQQPPGRAATWRFSNVQELQLFGLRSELLEDVLRSMPLLNSLDIHWAYREMAVEALAAATALRSLRLEHCRPTRQALLRIGELPGLHSLSLKDGHLHDLEQLETGAPNAPIISIGSRFTALTSLSLDLYGAEDLDSDAVSRLCSLTLLRHLGMGCSRWSDSGQAFVSMLRGCTALTSLDICEMSSGEYRSFFEYWGPGGLLNVGMERQIMQAIGSLPNLTSFKADDFEYWKGRYDHIYSDYPLPDYVCCLGKHVDELSGLTCLSTLSLANAAGFTLESLQALCTLTTLTSLDMSDCVGRQTWPGQLERPDRPSVGMLGALTGLTSLDLHTSHSWWLWYNLDEEDLWGLGELTRLTSLDLSYTGYEQEIRDDPEMVDFALGISRYGAGDSAMAALSKLTALTDIVLQGLELKGLIATDATLLALASLPALRSAALTECVELVRYHQPHATSDEGRAALESSTRSS